MRALVVGSGAREHSLAWKLSQEGWDVSACPGNPGMAKVAEVHPEAMPSDQEGILSLAEELLPRLIVVGPEDPLIAGMGDLLRAAGFDVFGPGRDGARLEGSKAWSKSRMAEAGVPTAGFEVFEDPDKALDWLDRIYGEGRSAAVKASGAALGKGVFVCPTLAEAREAVRRLMVAKEAGAAGATVVIEERLVGREYSLLTLVSESGFWSLPVAQDHKRAYEGDQGPNTGGMGAFSPVGWVTSDMAEEAEELIVRPILSRLKAMGIAFRGCLFSGIMVEDGRPYCLEYNARLGDPECQTVMRRLGPGLGEALLACAKGEAPPPVPVLPDTAVCITLASGGYPGPVKKGLPITLPAMPDGVEVFHAGTALNLDGALVTAGGRVLSVTAAAGSLEEARSLALAASESIDFEGRHMRTDIGLDSA